MAWIPQWSTGLLAQTRLTAHLQALLALHDPEGFAGDAWVERARALIASGASWDRPVLLGVQRDLPLAHLAHAACNRPEAQPWARVQRALQAGASPHRAWLAKGSGPHPEAASPWNLWTFLAHAHDTVGLERLQSWGWLVPPVESSSSSPMWQAIHAPAGADLMDDCGLPGQPACPSPRARFTTLVWAWRYEAGPVKDETVQAAALDGDLDVLEMLQQEAPARYDALRAAMHAPPATMKAAPSESSWL